MGREAWPEVALRMEQLRAVFRRNSSGQSKRSNMSVPVTVIALKSDKQYGAVAPSKLNLSSRFYVPGYDRIYVVLESV